MKTVRSAPWIRESCVRLGMVVLLCLASGGVAGQETTDLPPGAALRIRISTSLYAAAFSPDGAVFALGLYDRGVTLRESSSGRELRSLAPDDAPVSSLAFSPDGKFLATGGYGGGARVFEMSSGRLLRDWWGEASDTRQLSFSPDSRLLAWGAGKLYVRNIHSESLS